ncbi:MAG TPA: autotransporter domain-containing protein [Stellaceae bacterium]|nr:autotransporter domain-containing protein [Stellaceae bacterium]
MHGRTLTARLLATSSFAALMLAGVTQPARAGISCPGATYSATPFPGGFNNSGAIACILVNPAAPTVITGNISNSASGTIGPSPLASGAIVLTGNATLSGAIVNAGTIIGADSGSRSFGIGVSGLVESGITNSGAIRTIISNNTATNLTATGIAVFASSFGGGITNSGTITADASGASESRAGPAGIFVAVTTFTGNVANGGTIAAAALATGASAVALATGIFVGASVFSGAIVNSGSITAGATATGSDGLAWGAGIALDASSFSGGISNSGTIAAAAAAGNGSAFAFGLSVATSSFGGAIVNTGTISGVAQSVASAAHAYGITLTGATLAGGLSNGGTISANALVSHGTAGAQASALALALNASVMGTIVNSGSITAQAAVTAAAGGSRYTASAIGMLAFPNLISGAIVNSGTLSATASATAGCAEAQVYGVRIFVGTFSNFFTNSGTISAKAVANGDVLAVADATAVFLSAGGSTSAGGLVNSGTIIAQATASHGGTARAVGVASVGGTIVNSGTISGTATAPGGSAHGVGIEGAYPGGLTIANSGTITGSTWGIDLSFAGNAKNTINLTGGLVSGGNATGGGAILLSSAADTVNISGGTIVGNIQGGNSSATTGNVVNVSMGSGTLSYAGEILNIGVLNLKSGTLLLQNMSTPGVSTVAYNQSAASTLALEVSPAATLNHASVTASGAISLASGSVLQAYEGAFAWTPGTYSYAGVVTAGATTGSFTATSNSPFFAASLSQSSTVDNLTLTMLSPSQVPGLNADQQSVASAIIGIPGGNGTLDQLFLLPNPGPALAQLSGAQFTTTNYQPLIQAWNMFTDSLSDRLSQGAGYGGTVSASLDPSHGIQFAQADIPQVAQISDAGHGGAPASMPHQWGLWARGYGLSSDASSTATSAPYSESGAGLIIGADNQITDRIVAGVALNVASDKANVSGGGFTQTDAYQGSVYGQYVVDPNWYVNGIAGFGWQTYKSARVVTLLTTSVDNGSFDGQSYRLYGESGYTLHPAVMPLTRITPYLGLGYLHTRTAGFTESGTTALTVQAMDANSFTTTLGARAATSLQIGTTVFRPEIRVAWQHEFLDQAGTIRAAFAAAPGSPVFTATGTGFGRESFLGGAGITTIITASTQLFVDYDAKVNGGYTAQAISGGLRVAF